MLVKGATDDEHLILQEVLTVILYDLLCLYTISQKYWYTLSSYRSHFIFGQVSNGWTETCEDNLNTAYSINTFHVVNKFDIE